MKFLKQPALVFLLLLALHACAVGQAKQEAALQDTVCVTRTGKKYHECTCRYLHSSSIPLTLKDAIDRGYTACSVCEPPAATVSTTSEKQTVTVAPDAKPAKENTSTSRQCMANTKSGLRCKRTTTSTSGKCWQHE